VFGVADDATTLLATFRTRVHARGANAKADGPLPGSSSVDAAGRITRSPYRPGSHRPAGVRRGEPEQGRVLLARARPARPGRVQRRAPAGPSPATSLVELANNQPSPYRTARNVRRTALQSYDLKFILLRFYFFPSPNTRDDVEPHLCHIPLYMTRYLYL